MNPFDVFMTETVCVIKETTGQRLGPYKCMLTGDSCAIDDKTLDVEHGDTITRTLPNNKEEHYTVLRADYREDFEGILGGYELKLRKEQQIHNPSSSTINNININNSTGFQVGNDNSQNNAIQHLAPEYNELKSLLLKLQEEVNKSSLPETEKKEVITEAEIIAEVISQPKEQQQNKVRKSLSYIKGLTVNLKDVTEIITRLGDTYTQFFSS